jgi:hypothetical protein
MTAVVRPIPTVPVSPALLHEGDLIYPSDNDTWPDSDIPVEPFRVSYKPDRDALGWIIFLDGGYLLYLPYGQKVRTQRRPNSGPPTPDEAWDAAMDSYQRNRYG